MLAALLAMWIAVDDGDKPKRLDVKVGKTVEVDVGYTRGVRCDDLATIEVAIQTRQGSTGDATTNVFVVKGLREGTTQCRVGTEPQRPSILFDVRVTR